LQECLGYVKIILTFRCTITTIIIQRLQDYFERKPFLWGLVFGYDYESIT
jgi:hypothetical protein